jgi:hypothetical protein
MTPVTVKFAHRDLRKLPGGHPGQKIEYGTLNQALGLPGQLALLATVGWLMARPILGATFTALWACWMR